MFPFNTLIPGFHLQMSPINMNFIYTKTINNNLSFSILEENIIAYLEHLDLAGTDMKLFLSTLGFRIGLHL